jgi:phage-related holin
MDTPPTETSTIDQTRLAGAVARMRQQQNLPLAILAGIGAAILGAIIWAVLTVSFEYQIGFMAVGIGLLVGFAVRLGKGVDKIYGILGAAFSLFGCLLGNFFALLGFVAKNENISLVETLSKIDYAKVPDLMISTFSAMDLLFYGIAVYEGYKFSFRKISSEEIGNLQPPSTQ